MKVLHFYKTYYPESYGGVEQVIYQLAQGGADHAIEADVLYLSRAGMRRDEMVGQHRVHSVPMDFEIASTGFSREALTRFKALAQKADIIHYHFPWPFMDLVHFLSGVKKPVVVSYHSDIVRQKFFLQLYKPLMHCFLRRADVIVAASPAYIEHSSVLKKYRHKTRVIPYGLDEASYPVPDAALVQAWQQKLPPRFFLFVGALRYYKGLQYLIQAAASTGLPVVIVGGGGVEEELRQQARALKADNVIFTGPLSNTDKVALLQLCTAFVFPSHLPSEAFGISMLEAAMYGKPMISCEIGTGTTFINIHGETGLVVAPADSKGLALAMSELWRNSDFSQYLGLGARLRFEKKFTSLKMLNSYANIYKEFSYRLN